MPVPIVDDVEDLRRILFEPLPNNFDRLLQFLNICSKYRRHITNYNILTRKLYLVLRSGQMNFTLSDTETHQFYYLMDCLYQIYNEISYCNKLIS